MLKWNLAQLPDEERKQVNMDKAAAAVAYLERMGKPVVPEMEMRQFPPSQWPLFQERLAHYRKISTTLPRGSDPVYLKPDEKRHCRINGGKSVKPRVAGYLGSQQIKLFCR